jgi:hypothetical protein
VIGGDLTWYQSRGSEFESCLLYLPPISIKYFTCWTSLIKRELELTREGEY